LTRCVFERIISL